MIGKWVVNIDVRQFGDHNPSAANVMHAAGWGWGFMALLLDAFKAAIPVSVAWFLTAIQDLQIIPSAVSPIMGHTFSPWLKFKDGKAVASTFGSWTGIRVTPYMGATLEPRLGVFVRIHRFTKA